MTTSVADCGADTGETVPAEAMFLAYVLGPDAVAAMALLRASNANVGPFDGELRLRGLSFAYALGTFDDVREHTLVLRAVFRNEAPCERRVFFDAVIVGADGSRVASRCACGDEPLGPGATLTAVSHFIVTPGFRPTRIKLVECFRPCARPFTVDVCVNEP